jgi:hypothetical protein
MKVSFTASHRVTVLKCLQYHDDEDSPGYVLYEGDWVENRTLILEYFNPDQPKMIHWMKPLGYEIEELVYLDENLNGKNTNIHKSAYSFYHSCLFTIFVDYDRGKSPAPQLQRLSQQISAGVEALKKCVRTCKLEVMIKLYDKKNISKDTVKLKKRKAYFHNNKVATAKQKLQEKESEMGISSDD